MSVRSGSTKRPKQMSAKGSTEGTLMMPRSSAQTRGSQLMKRSVPDTLHAGLHCHKCKLVQGHMQTLCFMHDLWLNRRKDPTFWEYVFVREQTVPLGIQDRPARHEANVTMLATTPCRSRVAVRGPSQASQQLQRQAGRTCASPSIAARARSRSQIARSPTQLQVQLLDLPSPCSARSMSISADRATYQPSS